MANKKNYLDFVPVYSNKITWSQKDDAVIVDMYHKGLFPWIAQRFFKRPKVSHITLDKLGSFIWLKINGTATVFDIANCVKEQFGEDAEPLYPRLIKYMQILKNNNFINFVKEK